MGRYRKRSGSGNSHKDMVTSGKDSTQHKQHQMDQVVSWMELMLTSRQDTGQSVILHQRNNLALLSAYLTRAQQLQDRVTAEAASVEAGNKKSSKSIRNKNLVEQLLLERDVESHYTALHWALYRGDLATILLLLRHGSEANDRQSHTTMRLRQKPMALLEFTGTASGPLSLWQKVASVQDAQGFTPGQLLASLQQSELRACRASLPRPKIRDGPARAGERNRHHRNPGSFDLGAVGVAAGDMDDEQLFDVLQQQVHMLRQEQQSSDSDEEGSSAGAAAGGANSVGQDSSSVQYGCEVMTFGRAHHCALGVGTDTSSSGSVANADSSGNMSVTSGNNNSTTFRPQRVQAFAQSQVGRGEGAVGICAATHHTMVLNRAGQVFAFGLGKGGRLGTGSERHSPLPVSVSLPRRVSFIAAAENHSLAVTTCGQVYAWGSNRFGQLGISTTSNNNNNQTAPSNQSVASNGTGACMLAPRRVDDLKDVCVRAVAAGERHSVALSATGQVYVWGDNSSGQLGLPPRRAQQQHKVQQVVALNDKTAIAVAASDFVTMCLILPPRDGSTLPVNAVYSWGHGNHVPSRVHLLGRPRSNSRSAQLQQDEWNETGQKRQMVSPIAIACAKYHNVVITQNGLVYTWGLHAEALGTANSGPNRQQSKKNQRNHLATMPHLVEGMLPENGGGLAVAVSASENHTAVLTDTGALFTWGATHGPNILGHEGVRWQPDPKRVPGLYRGVAVAAAKEHIVVLTGTSFPSRPSPPSERSLPSLEELCAHRVTEFVDLFNVLPILITAERAQNESLVRYCLDFCKRNLDGVLNVGQRSVLDCYLTEQLQSHVLTTHHLDAHEQQEAQDAARHPIFKDFVLGSAKLRPASLFPTELLPFGEWVSSCELLMESVSGKMFLQKCLRLQEQQEQEALSSQKSRASQLQRRPTRAVSFGENQVVTVSECSLRCLELTKDEICATTDLPSLQDRQLTVMKEVRAIRKRLAQISKLEDSSNLSPEQREKVARKPQLEADLDKLEPVLARIESCICELTSSQSSGGFQPSDSAPLSTSAEERTETGKIETKPESISSFRCGLCGITCCDESSYALHLNGRKHRNRVQQAEQEEQARKAALVEAEHQRQFLQKQQQSPNNRRSKPLNPWTQHQGGEPKSPTPHPVYKLPPPPHEVPSSLSLPTKSSPASLRDIMADETRKAVAGQKPKPKFNPSPQATKTTASPALASSPSRKSTPKASPGSPWQLKVESLPSLESPPWNKPVARVEVHDPLPARMPASSSFKIVDYMETTSPPRQVQHEQEAGPKPIEPNSTAAKAGWVMPRDRSSGSSDARPAFASIQDEEMAFKEKQPRAGASGVSGEQSTSKWFVERRERAGSLKEIQKSAEKERQDRLFVEQQIRIEKQIRADLEKKRLEEEAKAKKKARKRAAQRKQRGQRKEQGRAEGRNEDADRSMAIGEAASQQTGEETEDTKPPASVSSEQRRSRKARNKPRENRSNSNDGGQHHANSKDDKAEVSTEAK